MPRRRFLSTPVSEELDAKIRLAAKTKGVTLAAWVRDRLLDALHHPRPPAPLSKSDELKIARLSRMPKTYTVPEVSALLALSPDQVRQALRAGDLVGHLRHRAFWDPGRGRFLRREWWVIGSDQVWAFIARRSDYQQAHGLRPYTRRAGPAPGRARLLADNSPGQKENGSA